MTTQVELNLLKKNYAKGVLEIREGDTWLKFNSMKDMRVAIKDVESELLGSRPGPGVRLTSTSKGY